MLGLVAITPTATPSAFGIKFDHMICALSFQVGGYQPKQLLHHLPLHISTSFAPFFCFSPSLNSTSHCFSVSFMLESLQFLASLFNIVDSVLQFPQFFTNSFLGSVIFISFGIFLWFRVLDLCSCRHRVCNLINHLNGTTSCKPRWAGNLYVIYNHGISFRILFSLLYKFMQLYIILIFSLYVYIYYR